MAYALFLDILGTSSKLCALPADYNFEQDKHIGYPIIHGLFREAMIRASKRLASGAFLALFSDCVYYVHDDPLLFTRDINFLIREVSGLPFRGGIGYGNFRFEQTSHLSSPSIHMNESSFYGSSLVFAYKAESCGLKGLRVFVHRSASIALSNLYDGTPVFPEQPLLGEDDGRPPAFGATTISILDSALEDIQHEICYIGDRSIETAMRQVDMAEHFPGSTENTKVHYIETKRLLTRISKYRDSLSLSWHQAASRYGFFR